MPWYNDLRPVSDDAHKKYLSVFENFKNEDKKGTIEGLLRLRKGLDDEITVKKSDRNLIVGTWNIKEFGHLNNRLPESFFYLAEVISRFDLIAIQEVKSKLDDLYKLMRLLGNRWAYIINDITEGPAGNSERSAYIYNKDRVDFAGLAGELVIPEGHSASNKLKQLKRTPLITGFAAGWKKFAIINVHLHPGNSADDKATRKEEIDQLLKLLKEKVDKKRLWTENIMVMGDFNLYKDDTAITEMIAKSKFLEISNLAGKGTNASGKEAFDHIYFLPNKYFQLEKEGNKTSAGVFDTYRHVYRNADVAMYKEKMEAQKDDPSTLKTDADYEKYFTRYWRIGQLSDHLPLWFEMIIDSSEDFLKETLKNLGQD